MRLRAAAALVLAVSAPSGGGSGVRPPPPAPAAAADAPLPVERGRDPLGLVRKDARPRVWVLFDTSTSMTIRIGRRTRHAVARETLEHAIRTLVSDAGEPLVHWRIASFRAYRWDWPPKPPMEAACADPKRGLGLPPGSPPGPPVWRDAPCSGMVLRTTAAGCDAAAARTDALENLPPFPNADITPNGVGLRQLAAHIRNEAIADLEPGQQNIVLLLTDGVDTCECDEFVWRDPHHPTGGTPGWRVSLRRSDHTPDPDPPKRPRRFQRAGMNAGLKAKAAFWALNDGDPDAGIGDIYIIGFGGGRGRERDLTNHLAWMASDLRRPAYHARRPEALAEALDEVLRAVTLPEGEVKVGAPRLATVKELVASGPTDAFAGTDPTRARDALVARPGEPKKLAETLRLRRGYADNVLLTTSADLGRLRGRLVARPVYGGSPASAPSPTDGEAEAKAPGAPVIWDAGARLERRDPAGRLILFHRAGETRLRRFEVGTVTGADLGVEYGFLRELDGRGAKNAADAAEIVVRLVRGERIAVHPETRTIYGPDGRPYFIGGVGTWKLRESLASPVAAGSPPRHPDAAPRERAAYRRFFERRVNRRTVVYLPTSGGMLHAFAADTGEELFAFIPADVLGPTPEERNTPGGYDSLTGLGLDRVILRDLAAGYAVPIPGRQVGLVGRYTLAGSPVVRDVYLREAGEWATVLAFGRDFGGRFVTALDVSEVGGDWNGAHRVQHPGAGGRGLPKLLFHLGNRVAVDDGAADGFGETPPPLLVEAPAAAGSGGEWTAFAAGGAGSASDDSGEWLFEIAPGTGRIRRRHRLAAGADPEIAKNGAPTAPAPWSPSWANPEANDLVTRLYLGDLHGQVHRLALDEAGRRMTVAHRLGGKRPIVTRPVAFPFPGRYEPHLLVVTGGDRRVAGEPASLFLLRETSGRLEEVWRRDLPAGEAPQGSPAVRIGRGTVEVLLATTAAAPAEVNCGATVTGVGVSRLRAFNGSTGAPAPGALGGSGAAIEYGAGRIRGLSVSSSGNVALGVSQSGGGVFDTVIGDFRFKVSEGALTEITFFVEGLRRSPF